MLEKKHGVEENSVEARIPALTVQSEFSESEFLTRELKLDISRLTPKSLVRSIQKNYDRGQRTVLITSGDQDVASIMDLAPPESLLVIQISDENYAPHRFFLYGHRAVKRIFRNYSLEPAELGSIAMASIGFLGDTRMDLRATWQLVGALREMRQHRRRARRILALARTSFSTIPLGYTNKFALAYCEKFNLAQGESLVEHRGSNIPRESGKRWLVSFVGMRGRLQRVAMYETFKELRPRVRLEVIDGLGWLGQDGKYPPGNSYVDTLLDSVYVACPPGTIANESFRVMEAQICGAIPFGLRVSLFQGSTDTGRPTVLRFHSWRAAKQFVQSDYPLQTEPYRRVMEIREALAEITAQISSLRSFN